MNDTVSKLMPVTLALICCLPIAPKADAYSSYHGRVNTSHHHYRHHRTVHGYFAAHPKIKAMTIGAGVGTAAGAVTGLVTGRGVVRGALIGAGAGAGVGLVRSSHTMRRHPIIRDVATGSLVGWGLGYAGGRMHGTAARGTLVGAAGGLATGLLTHGI